MKISNIRCLFRLYQGYGKWFLFSILLNMVVAAGTLAIPAFSADLIDKGILLKDLPYSLHTGFFMLIAAVIAGICQIGNAAILEWPSPVPGGQDLVYHCSPPLNDSTL